ncbi:MAG: hypothetical protein L0Y71_04580 [Gemmataceae bacterium]|nr:hypothetical protein [Gemmataceae bacterium]
MRRFAWLVMVLPLLGLSCAPSAPTNGKNKGPVNIKVEAEVPDALKSRIEAALEHVKARDLETTYGFWTIFHAILGLGPDRAVLLKRDTGERVNAMDYICKGNPVRGLRFIVTPHGLDVETAKPGSDIEVFVGQGHQDQFVAEMVQWGLPADTKFVVNGSAYTFMDFVRHSKMRASVTQKQELSWAILIIGEHFGTDHAWTNERGEKLRFEDIVRYELNEPIDTAACGGTHRLFGLTWAFHLHRQKGGKLGGVWKEVQDKLDAHKLHAKKHRNPDGTFSTDYFKGPGDATDNQLRISTTGHILEWLSLYLSDRELGEAWVQEAANALAKAMIETRLDPIEGGALYHAAHGLNMYHSRVFGAPKTKRPFPLPVQ